MNTNMRLEADSIGTLEVPADAYYGVQAQRAARNFRITGQHMNRDFIRNLAMIKKAAAIVNKNAGLLSKPKCDAICTAAGEVIDGRWDSSFIVDSIQGGAGTSANMNMNEVIANRANELLGGTLGSYDLVHPNDDVNKAQSTNDTIPTAGKMTVLDLADTLDRELEKLETELRRKSVEFNDVLKMGRTQLQDAVPMTLGESFAGYASMISRCRTRLKTICKNEMTVISLGATAIGSGINASVYYRTHIAAQLSATAGRSFTTADDLFDATENLDGFAAVSGALKACALSLSKMCNDLRLLSSGPRCGLNEINLPPMQNGSSIMPGKVNPVIPEVVTQAAFLVAGHDTTITMAAEAGQLELNAFEPVTFHCLFESFTALTGAVRTLTANCIEGITANKERCLSLEQNSVGIATALCPYIGYVKSAKVAKEALRTGKSVRDVVLAHGLMSPDVLTTVLDAKRAVSA